MATPSPKTVTSSLQFRTDGHAMFEATGQFVSHKTKVDEGDWNFGTLPGGGDATLVLLDGANTSKPGDAIVRDGYAFAMFTTRRVPLRTPRTKLLTPNVPPLDTHDSPYAAYVAAKVLTIHDALVDYYIVTAVPQFVDIESQTTSIKVPAGKYVKFDGTVFGALVDIPQKVTLGDRVSEIIEAVRTATGVSFYKPLGP
jgi:hypothetical protein